MASARTTTKIVTLEDFQHQPDRFVREVATGEARITIEQDGEALAILEPVATAEQRAINALMQDPDFRDLAAISEALKDYPLDEKEAQVAQGLREGRERRRKEREQAPTDGRTRGCSPASLRASSESG